MSFVLLGEDFNVANSGDSAATECPGNVDDDDDDEDDDDDDAASDDQVAVDVSA